MSTSTAKNSRPENVSLTDVNNTLQSYLGAYYVNDFFYQDRNWQVNVQADPRFRMKVEDIGDWRSATPRATACRWRRSFT